VEPGEEAAHAAETVSKPLVIEPEAEFDLFEAFDYYEHQREGLGQDFLLCFEAAIEAIAERPRSFPIVTKRTRRTLMKRFPYSVLFVELPDVIAVIGVFHGSRDPKLLRRRAR
jgi:toxin ParE1/3/4